MKRVNQEFTEVIKNEGIKYTKDSKINLNDAVQPWWTTVYDSVTSMKYRYYDFLCTMMYENFENGIVVTHSLFLRNFSKTFIGEELKKTKIGKLVSTKKLQNAGCIRLKIDFIQGKNTNRRFGQENETAVIREAELMFGSEFNELHETNHPI